jgi:uncharacterized membrane protein YkoI
VKFTLATALLLTQAPASAHPLGSSVIGLTRALAIVERSSGGRIVDGELEYRGGRAVYEIETINGDLLREFIVDAHTGSVLGSSPLRIKSLWAHWFNSEEVRHAGRAHPLAAILDGLEKRTDGKVTDVSLEFEHGRAHYEIEIATPAGATDLHLDALTGRRLVMVLDD